MITYPSGRHLCKSVGDYKSPGLIGRTLFTTDNISVGTPGGFLLFLPQNLIQAGYDIPCGILDLVLSLRRIGCQKALVHGIQV